MNSNDDGKLVTPCNRGRTRGWLALVREFQLIYVFSYPYDIYHTRIYIRHTVCVSQLSLSIKQARRGGLFVDLYILIQVPRCKCKLVGFSAIYTLHTGHLLV